MSVVLQCRTQRKVTAHEIRRNLHPSLEIKVSTLRILLIMVETVPKNLGETGGSSLCLSGWEYLKLDMIEIDMDMVPMLELG
jgi:hypothetical protein